MHPIPFNRPCLAGNELAYIEEAIRNGHSASGGPFTHRVTELLAAAHQGAHVLLTTSCTDALEMSAMLLGIGPGDVVIVPSFTFPSTALAFARQGATIRFCDIEADTLGLDPKHAAAALTPEVKAIVTVHYAGVPSNIDALVTIAGEAGAALVEDNAHGLFATHRDQPLGTFGRLSTLSFHETKNFICGEGGALVLNDPADVDAAYILLDKGTNRRQFLNGLVDKYTWQGLGSSFGMSDLLAAFLAAQLERAEHIRAARRHVAESYRSALAPFVDELGIRLPYEPATATPADHMFYVLLPHDASRDDVLGQTSEHGVHATFHYVPLHSSPAGRRFTDRPADCPITDDVSARLIRLPFYNELTDDDVACVVDVLVGALRRSRTAVR